MELLAVHNEGAEGGEEEVHGGCEGEEKRQSGWKGRQQADRTRIDVRLMVVGVRGVNTYTYTYI